ncbi:hypothetical protein H0N95_01000 [Candidatus Micrarchaeota archaeon]|nr:hypothetical protein [Candidatus Micrarchaeota archaeon]
MGFAFSKYVKAGKRVAKSRSVRLGSNEARLMKEIHESTHPDVVKRKQAADKIADMYYSKGMTLEQIEKELKMSSRQVRRAMNTFGLPQKTSSEVSKENWEKMDQSKKDKIRKASEVHLLKGSPNIKILNSDPIISARRSASKTTVPSNIDFDKLKRNLKRAKTDDQFALMFSKLKKEVGADKAGALLNKAIVEIEKEIK